MRRHATNIASNSRHGSGAIKVPDKASTVTMPISAADDAKTHLLGIDDHMWRRSRRT